MKRINVSELYHHNYSLDVVGSAKQYWETKKTFTSIGSPKVYNMLLYLSGCSAEYTQKNGKKLYAKSKNIIYVPQGAEYSLRLFDFENDESHTIGVNFLLYDDKNEPSVLSKDIRVFDNQDSSYSYLFQDIFRYSKSVSCPGGMKGGVYTILSRLSQQRRYERMRSKKYMVISKGIEYLENDDTLELSIHDIAAMCNVSEVYFRRLFFAYAGVTPVQYKIDRKIEMAITLLKYEDMSVADVAEQLGFSDSTHLINTFKKKTGMTPTSYIKNIP